MSDLYKDPIGTAEKAAAAIAEKTGKAKHDVALVMGSGWITAADALGRPTHEFSVTDIPGFPAPTVVGHGGKVRSYELAGGVNALVFLGRTHFYEGLGMEPVAHAARTAVKAGCKAVVLTNACGGINTDYKVNKYIPTYKPENDLLVSDLEKSLQISIYKKHTNLMKNLI
jgi:purine-nucleoside phosphorylase